MKPPLNAPSSSSSCSVGISAVRSYFSPSGESAAGSRVPATAYKRTRRRSIATTNTSAHERPASGWSNVFIMYGGSPGRRGSSIGTHLPSPGADQAFGHGPGSLGANGGKPALGAAADADVDARGATGAAE